jgi:hypothetical protein
MNPTRSIAVRKDATWRQLGEDLAAELHDELFFFTARHRTTAQGTPDQHITAGHLYQFWYMRMKSTGQERNEAIVRIEHLITLMRKWHHTNLIGREIARWNRVYAPDPVLHKAHRIILETTLYEEAEEPERNPWRGSSDPAAVVRDGVERGDAQSPTGAVVAD